MTLPSKVTNNRFETSWAMQLGVVECSFPTADDEFQSLAINHINATIDIDGVENIEQKNRLPRARPRELRKQH
jgi:hypothetical protein